MWVVSAHAGEETHFSWGRLQSEAGRGAITPSLPSNSQVQPSFPHLWSSSTPQQPLFKQQEAPQEALGENQIGAKLSPPCQQTCTPQSQEPSRSCLPTKITRLIQRWELICPNHTPRLLVLVANKWEAWACLFRDVCSVPRRAELKRLLPSAHPSAGPQHAPLLWLCCPNPFLPSLAWISLLISNCVDLMVWVCVQGCNVMQWNAA